MSLTDILLQGGKIPPHLWKGEKDRLCGLFTDVIMSPQPILIESDLVERARSDQAAFAELYRQLLKPVYGYLYLRLERNAAEAEDLTSQVFLEALEALVSGAFKPRTNFVAFVFTIARRRLIDVLRMKAPQALQDTHTDPQHFTAELEQADEAARLQVLLKRLEPEQREIVHLHHTAGLSFKEIAAVAGKKESAVKLTYYRSLDWIKSQWEVKYG